MGLFGRKKQVETPPVEDIPPLPTLEKIHEEGAQTHSEMPKFWQVQSFSQLPLPPQPPQNLQPVKKQESPKPAPPVKIEKEERPVFAPLFVKIDRYRNILNSLGQLKTSIVMIRNSFSTLNELEKARIETLKLIQEAVEKLESKISALDSELLRPTGFHTQTSPEYQDVETVQATVADLKGQIEQLKTELEHIG